MAGGIRKLGAAFVELFVKKDKFSADLAEAKSEVSSTADGITRESAKAGTAVESVGEKIKETGQSLRAIRSAVGLVAGAVGLVTTAFAASAAALRIVKDLTQGSKEEMDRFAASSKAAADAIRDSQASIAKMRSEIASLNGGDEPIKSDEVDKAQAKVEALQESLRQLYAEAQDHGDTWAGFWGKVTGTYADDRQRNAVMVRDAKRAVDAATKELDTAQKLQNTRAEAAARESYKKQLADRIAAIKIAAQVEKHEAEGVAKLIGNLVQEKNQDYYNQRAENAAKEHDAKMAAIEKEHEQAMRLQEEFYRSIRAQFTGLGGIRRLADLPGILERMQRSI